MKKTAYALNFAGQARCNFHALRSSAQIFQLSLSLSKSIALVVTMLCMNVGFAQDEPSLRLGPFEAQPRPLNPLRQPFKGGGRPTPVALDVDKDGDPDVVVAHYPGSDGLYSDGFHYLRNEGSASKPVYDRIRSWSNPFEFIAFSIGSTPAFSDVDKDGDTDMLIGSEDGTFRYYRNNGEPTAPYKPETGAWNATAKTGNPFFGIDLGNAASPVFTDMDGDGDDDVVIGTSYLPNYKSVHYYVNNGSGNFTPGTLTGINPNLEEVTPVFIDLDKDNDLDLLLGAADGKIYYYKRTGQTSFEVQAGAANPFNAFSKGTHSSPTSADFDNDGDPDVIIGTENSGPASIAYFENKGNGTFEEKNGFSNPFDGVDAGQDSAPYFADIDKDGDRDVIIGGSSGTLRYYANVDGAYVEQATNPFAGLTISNTFVPSFIDLDGDGDKDLVGSIFTGTETRIAYYKNENGVFVQQTFSSGPFAALAVNEGKSDFSDIDGDGDFDLFISDLEEGSTNDRSYIRYFKNTGTPQSPVFTELTGTSNPLAAVSEEFVLAPRFIDIDHDGDLDAIIGEGGDVVEISDGNELSYYENTGSTTSPVFTYRGDVIQQGDSQFEPTPAFVDQDNDGDLDLFQGGISGYILYYRNTNPAAVATLNTSPYKVLPGAGPVIVDAELLLSDADNDSIVYATVTISGFQVGKEVLSFSPQAGITGTFNATTGVLTFSGKAPLSQYQSLLRTVALEYTGELPSGRTRPSEFVTLSRTVAIQVFDADRTISAPASRNIIITTGEAPVFTDETVSVTTRGTTQIDLSQLISDVDSDIDLSTLAIVQQPGSGATVVLNGTQLTIDYETLNFTGTETLVLQVCDAAGICDQSVITVNVEAGETAVEVFNAIAPNNRSDENQYMRISNLPQANKVSIFNRWGDEVFVMHNYDDRDAGKRFDGTGDNGKALASGTYFYKIEFVDQASKRQTVTGFLLLKQ